MASSPMLDDPNQSTQRAKTRIAVATVLLAVAIGGLALISRNKTEDRQTVPNQTGASEVVVDKSTASAPQTVAPSTMSSEEQEPPLAPKPLPAPDTPKTELAPPPPPPPPTVSTPEIVPPNNAPIKKLISKPVPVVTLHKPELSPPVIAPTPTKPVQQVIAPTQSVKTTQAESGPVTPGQVTQKSEAPVNAETVKPVASVVKNYEVQLGVFTDMENAKQLQAKLTQNGIPSHSETRVQVGPFANKAEADAAKEKLKALGIGAVVVQGK